MKLRDKKTGEIWTLTNRNEGTSAVLWVSNGSQTHVIESIEELANNFEDYEEPKEFFAISPYKIEGYEVFPYDNFGHIYKLAEELGIVFKTRDEAEKAVEKLKAWKRLKDKGFRFESWWGGSKDISFWIDTEIDENIAEELDLLFGGEE